MSNFLGYSVTAPSPEASTETEGSGKAPMNRNRKRTAPDPGIRNKRSRQNTNAHHPRNTAETTSSRHNNSDCSDYAGISTNDQSSEPIALDKDPTLSAANQQAPVTPLWSSSNLEQSSVGGARATMTEHSTLPLDWDTIILKECAATSSDEIVPLDWDNFLNNTYTTTSSDPLLPLDWDTTILGTLPSAP